MIGESSVHQEWNNIKLISQLSIKHTLQCAETIKYVGVIFVICVCRLYTDTQHRCLAR